MSLTIADAESSYAQGRVQWEQFMREFSTKWFRPQAETMLAMLLAGITPDEQEQLGPQVEAARQTFDRMMGRGRQSITGEGVHYAPRNQNKEISLPGNNEPAAPKQPKVPRYGR